MTLDTHNTDHPEPHPESPFVPAGIHIFPNVWPGEPLPVQPGDEKRFVPMGCCFSGPIIMRPWDNMESAISATTYYGAQAHGFHPLHGAPVTEPSGGVLYFDSGEDPNVVISALSLMHAPLRTNDYAVFVSVAEDAESEGFMTHCRILPLPAIVHFFGAKIAPEDMKPQPMILEDFIRSFISLNEKRYGSGMCSDLSGVMGGDGDWARESLCFGFMVENEYHRVCRIWSRAWLVTK